ncbi:MAG TPA: squalene/phytoene synthase family protein [Gemmatimonadales bacterium]|nr:squalene/phytoene synthase family protein [Gemmatimonadales bacterium]
MTGAPAFPPELSTSYAAAERVTAAWARSFYFASRFLPADKRRAIFALYDYCRHADNLVDRRGDRSPALVRADLAELGVLLGRMHAGAPPEDGRWLALADTLRRYPIPLAPLLKLLEGVAMDLDVVEFRDFATLRRYCRLVAGGVGLMLGPILGAEQDGFSASGVRLGIAMQLTNVLRDVAEDLDAGRVYLPADELARFGLSRADLERRRVTPAFRRLMRFQVRRARRYFASGGRVVRLFPADGSRLTVRLLQKTYAGILDAIERLDYDVFRARAYVSAPRKLMILGRAMWTERPWLASTPTERSA